MIFQNAFREDTSRTVRGPLLTLFVQVAGRVEGTSLGRVAAFSKMQIPGLHPWIVVWVPSKSAFNMHPRWFSCKPTFKKHYFKKVK